MVALLGVLSVARAQMAPAASSLTSSAPSLMSAVSGAMDLRERVRIGAGLGDADNGNGYDHNWCASEAAGADGSPFLDAMAEASAANHGVERGGGERGADPDERAVALGRLLGLGVLALHEDDAEGEQEEGEPLAPAEALAEEDDREERGGDRLRLVEHLARRRRQVGEGEEDQIVLQRVAERGHRQPRRLAPALPDLGVQLRQQVARAVADGRYTTYVRKLGAKFDDELAHVPVSYTHLTLPTSDLV